MPTSSEARPYRIVRLLGRGGMAQVFEAIAAGAHGFERRVAVKQILADHHADPSILRSFLDEARLASCLHHGGVVAVLDYGLADGMPFQVLELVDGCDARSLVDAARKAGAPLPPALALHVCREVAHALHYAHEGVDAQGRRLDLVHRDVKPANILVSWSGDVKLGDFGIAFATLRTEQTAEGVAKGTLAYMAPEQSRGEGVDGRADLFSLGCVLHALVTGRSPLRSPVEIASLLLGEDPALDDDLPEDVRAIVHRATRGDRALRYPDGAAMAKALGEAVALRDVRDAKTELIAWLGKVRPHARAGPVSGRLDALLGADLFLGSADGEASGTISHRAGATRISKEPPQAAPAAPESASGGPPPRRDPTPLEVGRVSTRPRRRGAWIAVGGVLVALGVIVVRAGVGDGGPTARAERGLRVPALSPVDSGAAPAPLAEALDAPSATSPAVAARAAAPRPIGPPARSGSSAAPPATTPAPPVAAPDVLATLAVGAPVGAAIVVDGTQRGRSPKYIQLPPGPHRVQLVDAEGATVASGTVSLRADHTAASPLRWP